MISEIEERKMLRRVNYLLSLSLYKESRTVRQLSVDQVRNSEQKCVSCVVSAQRKRQEKKTRRLKINTE